MSEISNQVKAYKLDISDKNSIYSGDNVEQKQMEKLILKSNQLGMEYLKLGKKADCLELFKKCEKLLLSEYNKSQQNFVINRLLAITYNNLGCYYRKDEKPNVSLNYLKKSLMIEVYSVHDSTTIASTHLNICAILSRLNKHDIASEHAKIAIELLDLAKNSVIKKEEIQSLNEQLQNQNDQETQKRLNQKLRVYKDILNMQVLSYYNLGIEQEHLKIYENSLTAYQAGHEIAQNELGENHKMTQNLWENIMRLNKMQQSKEQKEAAKIEKRQKIYEEGYHQYIKHHINIQTEINQEQANKFFHETYCSKANQTKTQLQKIRNTQSISPHSRMRSRVQDEDSLNTIENPSTQLRQIHCQQRAQTVLKSRNDQQNQQQQQLNQIGVLYDPGFRNTQFKTINSNFMNLKIKGQDQQINNDTFHTITNRATVKSAKNKKKQDINLIGQLQQLKVKDKLPFIQDSGQIRQANSLAIMQENEDPQIFIDENQIELQQQSNFSEKEQLVLTTYGVQNKFMHTKIKNGQRYKNNTIDVDIFNSGNNNVFNNLTKETKFSTNLRADQINERSRTVSTKNNLNIYNHQNTFDLFTNNSPRTIQTNQDQNLLANNQQINMNQDFKNPKELTKINTTLHTHHNLQQDKNNQLQNEKNNHLLTEKFNPICTEQYRTIQSRQKDIENLQGQVRKSLNFNEYAFKQFDEKQQPDLREQEIQECLEKLVDIYQNQSQSIISPEFSSQIITKESPDQQKNLNNQRQKQILENQFQAFEKNQHVQKEQNSPKSLLYNKNDNFNSQNDKIKQHQLNELNNLQTYQTQGLGEQLSPYLQINYQPNSVQYSGTSLFCNNSQNQPLFKISPAQNPKKANEIKAYKDESDAVRIRDSETQSIKTYQKQMNQQQNQKLDYLNASKQNRILIKKPDSHQENSIDLKIRQKRQQNLMRNIEENIRFCQNKSKNITLSPLQKNIKDQNYSNNQLRQLSVKQRSSRQQQIHVAQHEQLMKENIQQINKIQQYNQKQIYNAINETNETFQNNLTQSILEEQYKTKTNQKF